MYYIFIHNMDTHAKRQIEGGQDQEKAITTAQRIADVSWNAIVRLDNPYTGEFANFHVVEGNVSIGRTNIGE